MFRLRRATIAKVEPDLILGNAANAAQYESLSQNDFVQHQLQSLQQQWQKNAIAQSLNASKAGRVYFIPAYLCLGLPGPIGTELYLNELRAQLLPAQ